ncbi:hypothetical protein ADUPG1_005102, partial [Aduncisulcus paluster]
MRLINCSLPCQKPDTEKPGAVCPPSGRHTGHVFNYVWRSVLYAYEALAFTKGTSCRI